MAGDIQQCIELAVLEELKAWQTKTFPESFELTASNERIDEFIDQRFNADNPYNKLWITP